jgi:hypothetical protein
MRSWQEARERRRRVGEESSERGIA